ncbi:MAG: DUF424 family protein [Nanoarchaeota archaeon]|nr:DUF424 family protein [Nanoarchaeota archaeon]
MILKVHEVKQGGNTKLVVALCDDDLVGKILGDGFFVNPRFYGGEKYGEKRVLELLSSASVVNAVGEDSVRLLLNHDLVKSENVVSVGGVPHAQVFVVNVL